MLKPIPPCILTTTATLKQPTGTNAWQNVTYAETTISKCHLQGSNEVRKTKTNTEVVLSAILFVDSRLSKPRLDWDAIALAAEEVGFPLKIVIGNAEYTVEVVDTIPDDHGHTHHIELGLV